MKQKVRLIDLAIPSGRLVKLPGTRLYQKGLVRIKRVAYHDGCKQVEVEWISPGLRFLNYQWLPCSLLVDKPNVLIEMLLEEGEDGGAE